MYKCLKCGNPTTLPVCTNCGYEFESKDGIYILTDAPDINLDDSKGDKYIGYESIGKYYSGGYWDEAMERLRIRGKAVSDIVGDGLLLELACGDGQITIPSAENGCRIIAGDISRGMLSILKEKAA